MDKLQQAKEALLTRIIQGDIEYDARFDAEAYNVLCQAELSARVAILTPNGEDIYPIQELRELLKENPDIGRVVFGMRRGAI